MDKLAYVAYQNHKSIRDTDGCISILVSQFKAERVYGQFKAYGFIPRQKIMHNIEEQMQNILSDKNPNMEKYDKYKNMISKFKRFGDPYYHQIHQHAYKPIDFNCLDEVKNNLDRTK